MGPWTQVGPGPNGPRGVDVPDLGRVRGDIASDNRRIDALLASFDRLSDCRKRQAAGVQGAYGAGTITRETAETQMAGVRSKFAEDRAKFREIADAISEKSRNNAALYNDIAADNGGNALVVQEYKPRATTARVTKAPAKKEAGTEGGSLKADKSEVNALQRDCLTNVKKRDDCYEKVAEAEEVEDDLALDLS